MTQPALFDDPDDEDPPHRPPPRAKPPGSFDLLKLLETWDGSRDPPRPRTQPEDWS